MDMTLSDYPTKSEPDTSAAANAGVAVVAVPSADPPPAHAIAVLDVACTEFKILSSSAPTLQIPTHSSSPPSLLAQTQPQTRPILKFPAIPDIGYAYHLAYIASLRAAIFPAPSVPNLAPTPNPKPAALSATSKSWLSALSTAASRCWAGAGAEGPDA
ncbi:hypothetical protein B0H34DRAFT_854163 [Crassisporium funariophilum]|nr:hypothetical protein B0H34DRAFT_854163 [Crassisporium funariophilum]